ncbi:hypothetical protein GCM10025762_11490 [Haloechinothrix salitolerans]
MVLPDPPADVPPLDSFSVLYGLSTAWNSAMDDVTRQAERLVAERSGGKRYDVNVQLAPTGVASTLDPHRGAQLGASVTGLQHRFATVENSASDGSRARGGGDAERPCLARRSGCVMTDDRAFLSLALGLRHSLPDLRRFAV